MLLALAGLLVGSDGSGGNASAGGSGAALAAAAALRRFLHRHVHGLQLAVLLQRRPRRRARLGIAAGWSLSAAAAGAGGPAGVRPVEPLAEGLERDLPPPLGVVALHAREGDGDGGRAADAGAGGGAAGRDVVAPDGLAAQLHADEDGEDAVADEGDGRLQDVGEEGGEGEAVGQVAAGSVGVYLQGN